MELIKYANGLVSILPKLGILGFVNARNARNFTLDAQIAPSHENVLLGYILGDIKIRTLVFTQFTLDAQIAPSHENVLLGYILGDIKIRTLVFTQV
ncbi:hypothetical protein Glove_189g16 [Diversispora epigaea]|uniref:Uncharacterized protein n=1 Tax=Diversispora epigaea TaxID=1348612 RepID=A0A397ILD4_9GLOM|nr:hypothetical protein Glove_189g16 [Diversispora epigaea]